MLADPATGEAGIRSGELAVQPTSSADPASPVIATGHSVVDFADPRAEGDAIVAALPAGTGTTAMIGGAGHYPHAQSPEAVAELVLPFLKEHTGA